VAVTRHDAKFDTNKLSYAKQKLLHKNIYYTEINWNSEVAQFSLGRHSPHWMEVKHRWLQFRKLDGSDSNCPDITLLVVSTFPLDSRHFRRHPAKHIAAN